MLSDFISFLLCPECLEGDLLNDAANSKLECQNCAAKYPVIEGVPILFLAHELTDVIKRESTRSIPLSTTKDAETAARHWGRGSLMEYLPLNRGGALLSFGCGKGGDRQFLESRGYKVVAFDVYRSAKTDLVCDGHRLPFKPNLFDVVTTIAVLEHLRAPWIALEEMGRVLKSNGLVVGSVASLEPYHADSYYHFTYLGIIYALQHAGFQVEEIGVGMNFLEGIFMNLVPSLPRKETVFFSRAAYRLLFHFRRRRGTRSNEGYETSRRLLNNFSANQLDELKFAGSIVFKARKQN